VVGSDNLTGARTEDLHLRRPWRPTASNRTTVQTLTTDPDAGTLVYNHNYNDSDEKNGCV
jgi:hypothetical protein